jgi:hypothetical protein
MKEIRKQKKKRKKRRKNMKRARGNNLDQPDFWPTAHLEDFRTGTSLSSLSR